VRVVNEVLNSYGLNVAHLIRLVNDVPDEDFVRQPGALTNHPAWNIGHLIFSCQALGGELALAPWLPPAWESNFGTGSIPSSDRSAYPSKTELLTALEDAKQRIAGRLTVLGDAGMGAMLPDERHRAVFPTVGHAVVHILVGHFAVHVGQLSAWRRAAGYPPTNKEAI
jgi:hypothetical protein